MRLEFQHSGKYTGSRFTVDEVINSLAAQRELLKSGAYLISHLDQDFRIDEIKILISRIESNSLLWDILVEVYGAYQERLQGTVTSGIEEMFGIDIPAEYEPLVTLGSLAVTYFVARYAYERVTRTKERSQPSVYISGEGNVVIQNIAEIVHQSPEAVERALERAVPPARRKALIPKVADFFRPAKKAPNERIEIIGAPPITAETLREFPSDAELAAVDDSLNIDVEGAMVEIRATDRDRLKTGWSAIVLHDERFPKRLPMDLYPTVDAEKLASHHFVRGNLVVECERGPNGSLKPRRLHLLSYDGADGQPP